MILDKMDFLTRIRFHRLERKGKEPFRRSLFTKIGSLVKVYDLGEEFLAKLDAAPRFWETVDRRGKTKKHKPFFIFPLFVLLSPAEYRITKEILNRMNNPYLHFAHSPEEIILSAPLFRLNPSLEPSLLARVHFETLLTREYFTPPVSDNEH